MDQTLAKRELQTLIEDLQQGNKTCCDCENRNPQWASLSHATFICLECAGQHRGFGVHISFVRSVSMDTWQEDQIRRMKLGGNKAFQTFANEYVPADIGGFKAASSIYEKYHSWTAKQYRDKLDAGVKGESWNPSLPPADWNSPSTPSSRPASAQGLRKARGSSRTQGSSLRQNSSSPASFTNSPPPTSGQSAGSTSPLVDDQKARNEAFFASLGATNSARSADLPPSQGGRYTGFGNTPSPDDVSSHPSYGLSSRNAPSLDEFRDDPSAALSKGWSLLSSAIMGATKTVKESVIQPGLERVRDPDFQANVRGYVDEAGRRVGAAGASANQWSKSQFGVDVADSVGGMYDNVRDRVAGGSRAPEGYGRVDQYHDHEEWERYDDAEDDFFDAHDGSKQAGTEATAYGSIANKNPRASGTATGAASSTTNAATQNSGWDDEWKDF